LGYAFEFQHIIGSESQPGDAGEISRAGWISAACPAESVPRRVAIASRMPLEFSLINHDINQT